MKSFSLLKKVFVLIALSVVIGDFAAEGAAESTNEIIAANSTIDGAALFQKMCSQCHGNDGRPPPAATLLEPVPPDLTSPTYPQGEQAKESAQTDLQKTIQVIRYGKGGGMIGFDDRLAAEQIESVARFVQTLRLPSITAAKSATSSENAR